MTPLEWFGCCLILWPIGVLFYLAKRQEQLPAKYVALKLAAS